MIPRRHFLSIAHRPLTLLLLAFLLALVAAGTASADPSPLHPTFPFLDENGVNVLESGKPVSTMKTCGACHDTDYIESHSFHTSVGLDHFSTPGWIPGTHPWEMSLGLYGKWDAISYRYLTPEGDPVFDLGTPDWIKLFGIRHVGGGPAVRTADGTPLTDLPPQVGNPTTTTHDMTTGEDSAWDWQQSGVEEMNCFLCHIPDPNNDARTQELQDGHFAWANTATLIGTGIVEKQEGEWQWNKDAFQENGELNKELVTIQKPSAENCGQCHGTVHESKDPLLCSDISPEDWHTRRTGQIFSGQRLSDSGLNLAGKENLNFPWDIHAERNLTCTDCHYSINNPIYAEESPDKRPDYLTFDPRHMDIGDYLYQPSHQFAKGSTTQHLVAPQYAGTMRRCESCHDASATHDWLPYKETHMEVLACESCHIPKLHSPAIEQVDWTVLMPDGKGQEIHRGIEGSCGNPRDLVTGYQPILLLHKDVEGHTKLTPFNLITAWYWVHDDPVRPVRLEDLKAVYFDGDKYKADIMAAFDANSDGQLDSQELRLDSEAKVDLIKQKLEALGLKNPRIEGEVQPYSINHDVVDSDWATKSCDSCHSKNSRLVQPFQLALYTPGNVMPEFRSPSNLDPVGEIKEDGQGGLAYQIDSWQAQLYVPGHNRLPWLDIIGWLALLGTLAGISVHGGLRMYGAARHARHEPELREIYMYTFYERLWHWLQAITILMLIATGLVIHYPDILGWADFGIVVPLHNVLAFILVFNALFSLFYHLASGEIRQYLPEPRGFFRLGLMQAEYYLRGIFQGKEHPFEKTPQHKLNPLQQVTYFAILNILLPLQIVTGLLMWGAGRWTQLAAYMPILAPVHTLVAAFFAAFVIMHVYLTTTGPTPLADIEAMITGWDKVEVHEHHSEA